MKTLISSLLVLICTCTTALGFSQNGTQIFINEIHYDNAGIDQNEGIEIAGAAGLEIDGWKLILYNGSTGEPYLSRDLSGLFVDQQGGFGTILFPLSRGALQNGPDGIVLIDPEGTVVQFLSYEGTFIGTKGPADNLQSTDIGVMESSASSERSSLQLAGSGKQYEAFAWYLSDANSFGQPNDRQRFTEDVGTCTAGDAGTQLTQIYDIQGDGPASPLVGSQVTTRGVVTGSLLNGDAVEGYYLQATPGDGDPFTSDALFIYTTEKLPIGKLIQVKGEVVEQYGVTSLLELDELEDCNIEVTVPMVDVLIESGTENLEQYESMLVNIEGPLQIVQNDNLLFYGELGVSLSRPFTKTNFEVGESIGGSGKPLFLIDDGNYAKNPSDVPLFDSVGGKHRVGTKLTSLTGIVGYGYGSYRVHPITGPVFEDTNPRIPPPGPLEDGIRVVGFNVLNYFTTLSGQSICGPNRNRDCRGTADMDSFNRHREKLVTTLSALNADIVGLVEMENTDGAAVKDLITGLNEAVGEETYEAVSLPSPGTDVIRVELIYKPEKVHVLGTAHMTTPSEDPAYNAFKRPALAQTFETDEDGSRITVVVNHFKSKGSCPKEQEDPENVDKGQGCWNSLRTQQARQLNKFIERVKEQDGSEHVLIIGDLNAYGGEDPIRELKSTGFVDLIEDRLPPTERYSYYSTHAGNAYGYLDHALASPGLAEKVHRLSIWHTNSDEPATLKHSHYKYQPRWHDRSAYGASDHDPVVVDIYPFNQTGQDPISLYYKGTEGLTGNMLRLAINDIIKDHRELPYRDIWGVLAEAHRDPANPNNIVLLYSGRSQAVSRNSGNNNSDQDAWNREHVWAKSHGLGRPGSGGPATDAHNLWPTDASINQSRGNKDFDNGGTAHHEAPETNSDGDSWEPQQSVRGDVARTMFYMAARYDGAEGEPDLELVDFTNTSGSAFGKLCTLLAWHIADPVSETENRRNSVIHRVQGNRNPFIDHPEWVVAIWGDWCPTQ